VTSLIDEPDLVICDPDDDHVPAELELELEFEFLYAAVEVDERAARPALAKTFLQAAVMATPVVILGLLSWTHRSMFADGYIYLHVVQNVLAGNGPVFDAGQRVEAVTSPTWTAILFVVGLVTRLPLTWIAVGLGVAFSVAGISLALAASGHLVRRVTPHGFLVARHNRAGDGPRVPVAGKLLRTLSSVEPYRGRPTLTVGPCRAGNRISNPTRTLYRKCRVHRGTPPIGALWVLETSSTRRDLGVHYPARL
jgi:hypothetical protein